MIRSLATLALAAWLAQTSLHAQLGFGDLSGPDDGPAAADAPLEAAPAESLLVFDVDGGIESIVGDGRFVLHGKLRMKDEGGGALSSLEAVDQFWRYTSVDPPNVFGDNTEQRFASVVLLPDRSAAAWNAATRPLRALGTATHRRYYRSRTLHTNKHFYVLGSPEGRFRVERDADGGLGTITNRLTRSWAAGGWDEHAGYDPKLSAAAADRKWAAAARDGAYGPGSSSDDYSWFPKPFRGLGKALALMKDSPYERGDLARTARGRAAYSVRASDFQTRFEELLTTLEPSASELWYEVPTPSMHYTRRVRDGVLYLSGATRGATWKGGWGILRKSGTLAMTRQLEVVIATGRVRKDVLTFQVAAGKMLTCDMTVGFQPAPAPAAD